MKIHEILYVYAKSIYLAYSHHPKLKCVWLSINGTVALSMAN